LVGRDPRPRI